ncbi:F-box/kelch-repeat protein At2g43445 [Brachypodium distachyon]|uniref:Uncharacterized protein n=1 Tax=Brachypodium distachyon TaxID=15368 RepID=A0A0Q3JXY8_BRADI|nr:F-box/kelch-repeat protein At2g43445 [Brachypodium distachyon]KQK16900.1 hypothetical protein BRADI_1g31324v3 [Brachypodium distachyon]|eukprot:XP_010229724.1 F-box/kelch-repeat protein At2g43445 [Brachypodium distachyon]
MDIFSDILSRLPAKCLLRFRGVSQPWRALMSDRAFLTRAEPFLVAVSGDRSTGGLQLQLMDMEGNVVPKDGLWNVFGEFQEDFSSDGEFCTSFDNLVCLYRPSATCLVDLATGEIGMFVDEPSDHPRSYIGFGVGRAAESGARKIIRDNYLTWEILTLGDNKWRPMQLPPFDVSYAYDYYNGTTINGVVYYLSLFEGKILCFDLEREEWTMIHGGPQADGEPWRFSLAELNGSLCLMERTRIFGLENQETTTVHLWLLQADSTKGTWAKAYTLHLESLDSRHIVMPLRVIHPGGKLLFYKYCSWPYSRSTPLFQVYDPLSGKCTRVEKAPTNVVGRIGLCSLSLDPRFRAKP